MMKCIKSTVILALLVLSQATLGQERSEQCADFSGTYLVNQKSCQVTREHSSENFLRVPWGSISMEEKSVKMTIEQIDCSHIKVTTPLYFLNEKDTLTRDVKGHWYYPWDYLKLEINHSVLKAKRVEHYPFIVNFHSQVEMRLTASGLQMKGEGSYWSWNFLNVAYRGSSGPTKKEKWNCDFERLKD